MFRFSKHFTKNFKHLAKKYHHIENDFESFLENFDQEHSHSITIRKNVFKARIKNSDKAKGKSGGYRTYYYTITDESVTFLIEPSEQSHFCGSVLKVERF
jgi:mRNA-degrading endonuclease RelE of RelBE toxin-antitoxin system